MAEGLQLTRQDATHVQVTASAAVGAAVVGIQGRWRWMEATVSRAHPGGSAGSYDIFVVAADNKIDSTPAPGTDNTNYAFDLRVLKAGETPTIVKGTLDIFRKIGSCEWSGTEITRVDQVVPVTPTHAHRHATGQPDAIAPADIGAAPLASPGLTGVPTAPTVGEGDETTKLATTSFVGKAIAALKTAIEVLLALKAPLASPALTGTPTAPTAGAGTNTTQIATTAYATTYPVTPSTVVGGYGNNIGRAFNTAIELSATRPAFVIVSVEVKHGETGELRIGVKSGAGLAIQLPAPEVVASGVGAARITQSFLLGAAETFTVESQSSIQALTSMHRLI